MFEKIAMPFIYSTCAMDGYFWAYTHALRIKYKQIFPVICTGILILAVMSTGKSLLIWAVILWLAGFLVGNQVFLNVKIQKGVLYSYIKKNIKKIVFVALIMIGLLMFMMFARRQKSINQLIDSMIAYGFGQVPCFAIWYKEMNPDILQYSMGKQLFFGFFDELKMSAGSADNWPLNITLYEQGVFSNIYTAHRGLIEDFGIAGSILFWLLVGIIGGYVERRVLHNKNKWLCASILLAFYVFILFSFLISAWHYLTIFLAVFFFGIELFCIELIKKRSLVIWSKGREGD